MLFKNKLLITACTAAVIGFTFTPSLYASDGKAVYEKTCKLCHKPGMMGAPKFGSKKDWAPRMKKGMDVLVKNAIKGYKGKMGMMPPKGGNPSLSEGDIKSAIQYMLDSAK